MDKITKLAQDHGEIFETLAFFNESISKITLDDKKSSDECVANLNTFFGKQLSEHFKYEENEIFPLVLSIGKAQEKHLVRELQHEHIDIMEKVDEIKDLIISMGYPDKCDKSRLEELVKLNKTAIETILKHARKEDSQLYPFLKDKGYKFQ
jgi:iron-sulfur cluster repair protein YtfE (RIC family)